MARVQLALNVSDVDEAVAFYTKLFGVGPAKRRPGYANFAVDDPSLKLVLIERAAAAGSLNHLGVEVASSSEVGAAQVRLADDGLESRSEEGVTCCYAVQDKIWVEAPDATPWEIYTVLADVPVTGGEAKPAELNPGGACCTTDADAEVAGVVAGTSACC
jgi:catechol 2,3-dioxygenase-like lactoylglutathione lyase family enzyme